MATYPSSIKTFTTKTDKVDLVSADHINDCQGEITAIETELGANVAGSVSDLVTRLAVSLHNDGSIQYGSSFPASPQVGQPFFRTDSSTIFFWNGAWASANGLSNVIYCWSGNDNNHFTATSSTTEPATATRSMAYQDGSTTAYQTVLESKWIKFSGVNTVTVYAYVNSSSTTGSNLAKVQVDIGGQSGSAQMSSSSTTFTWINFTIDVSSLSDGTAYDITMQLGKTYSGVGNQRANMLSIVLFGS